MAPDISSYVLAINCANNSLVAIPILSAYAFCVFVNETLLLLIRSLLAVSFVAVFCVWWINIDNQFFTLFRVVDDILQPLR